MNIFKPISQDQFTMAQDTLEKIRGLLDTRSHLIKQGSLQAELVLPNIIWKRITLFSYFLNPTYDIINTLRLHTFIFTGHYLGYAIVDDHNPLPDSLLKKYHKLTEGLPSEMLARPPHMLGEVGLAYNAESGLAKEVSNAYQMVSDFLASLFYRNKTTHDFN